MVFLVAEARADGLWATYFANGELTGTGQTRIDPTVGFEWSESSPASVRAGEAFGVHWEGYIQSRQTERYTISVRARDKVRLWIDDRPLIDQWKDQPLAEHKAAVDLTARTRHRIRLEVAQRAGGAVAELYWASPSTPRQIIPAACLYSGTDGGDFVRVSGNDFTLRGIPYRLLGYNMYYLAQTPPLPDERVEQTFSQVKSASRGNVIRSWFFEGYSEDLAFTNFDRIIRIAKKHDMRVIPVLVNHWVECEPTKLKKSLAWYKEGYKRPDPPYKVSYRDYAIALAKHYANEPTIAMWQLVNEAESESDAYESEAASTLRAFADDMTNAIRQVDPNHLVSLGTIGGGQRGAQQEDYEYVHAGKVDVCEVHDYGRNDKAPKIVAWHGDSSNGMQTRFRQANRLNKPIFVGEAGMLANAQPDGSEGSEDLAKGGYAVTPQTLAFRASLYEAKLQAQLGAEAAGFLIWHKDKLSRSYDIGDGDPTEAAMANFAPHMLCDWEDGKDGGWASSIPGVDPTVVSPGGRKWAGVGGGRHSLKLDLPAGASATSRVFSREVRNLAGRLALRAVVRAESTGGTACLYAVFADGRRIEGEKARVDSSDGGTILRLSLSGVAGLNKVAEVGVEFDDRPTQAGALYVDCVMAE